MVHTPLAIFVYATVPVLTLARELVGQHRHNRPLPSALYFVHNDHLGTPHLLTDAQQKVVWAADYTPFGILVNGNPTTETSRFPGQYFDVATGVYYNYFRDYDPALGRYVQSDPIGLADGPNTYS